MTVVVLAFRVAQVKKAHQDKKENLDWMVQEVEQVVMVLQDNKVHVEIEDHLDHQGQ